MNIRNMFAKVLKDVKNYELNSIRRMKFADALLIWSDKPDTN